jgi:cobalt-zinc-cadmium efflux system outer membrane protein
MIRACLLLVVVASLLIGPPARAQPGEPVTLAVLIDLLGRESPRTQALRSRVDVAAAGVAAARIWPNPILSYGGLQLLDGQNTGAAGQHQLVVEQPLLLFDQRGKRMRAAELWARGAQQEVTADLVERAFDLRQVYALLQARQMQAEVLESMAADLAEVGRIMRGRVLAGDKSEFDLLRVDLEISGFQAELAAARADVAETVGEIAAAIGRPGWSLRAADVLTLVRPSLTAEELWAQAQAQPALRAAELRVLATRAQVSSEERERWPVPALSAGTVLTQNAYSTSLLFGLSLPLPLFDRNQGGVARARAEHRVATLERAALFAEVHAALSQALLVWKERAQAAATLEGEVLTRLPALRRMAEAAYREGRVTVLELLDAFRTIKALRTSHTEALLAAKLAENRTRFAAGLLDPR